MGVDIIDNRRKRVNVESMVAFDGGSQYGTAINTNINSVVKHTLPWSISVVTNLAIRIYSNFSQSKIHGSGWLDGCLVSIINGTLMVSFYEGLATNAGITKKGRRWQIPLPAGTDLAHVVINFDPTAYVVEFFINGVSLGVASAISIAGNTQLPQGTEVVHAENRTDLAAILYNIQSFSASLYGHLSFFNRSLTPAEIQYIHRQGGLLPESTHADCVAHYPCTQREGNTLFDVVEQYNHAKVTPLIPYHATLQNFTAAQHTGDNQSAYKDFYTKQDLRPYVDSNSDGTPDSPLIEKKSGLPPLLKALKIESSASQSITLGNVGTIEGVRIATKLDAVNQSILSLSNTAATTIQVSAGVVTAGASITNLQIYVDGVAHNATDAGAILNDLKLHDVVFLFDSIAASDMRITSADKHIAALFVATAKPSRKQIIELANNTLLAQPKTNQQADISQMYNLNKIIDNAGIYELSNELGASNAVLNGYSAANIDPTDPAYSLTDIDDLR